MESVIQDIVLPVKTFLLHTKSGLWSMGTNEV